MIDCEFDTLILSLVLIWIFYVFNFILQLSKYIYYITPIILIVSSFLDYYYKDPWWISNKYHMYNFAVLLVTLFISYYLCNKDIKKQEDISTKKGNKDV